MNNDFTIEYTKKVLETFSFGRRFLAWDSYEDHMDSNTVASLTSSNIDQTIISRGFTKFIQAPDVSWNKPFKPFCAIDRIDTISGLQKKEYTLKLRKAI